MFVIVVFLLAVSNRAVDVSGERLLRPGASSMNSRGWYGGPENEQEPVGIVKIEVGMVCEAGRADVQRVMTEVPGRVLRWQTA